MGITDLWVSPTAGSDVYGDTVRLDPSKARSETVDQV